MEKALAAIIPCLLSCSVLADDRADQILRFDGLGPVRIEMSVTQAENALGAMFKPRSAEDDEDCWYTHRVDGVDPQVSYMIQKGVVVRIDVDNSELGKLGAADPHVVTDKGVRIFSTEEEVKQRYGGALETSPHPYMEEAGHYMKFLRSDGQRGLLFETQMNQVTNMRAGLPNAISLIEGCS